MDISTQFEKPAQTLFAACLALCYHLPAMHVLLIWYIFDNVILSMIMSELMYNISKGSMHLVAYFFILKIARDSIKKFYETKEADRIAVEIKLQFQENGYKLYNNMTFESKNNLTITKYEKCVEDAAIVIAYSVSDGLHAIINLTGSIIGCIWTFTKLGIIAEFIGLVIVCSIIYVAYIRNVQDAFCKMRKAARKIAIKLQSQITLRGHAFQHKEYTPEYMSQLKRDIQAQNLLVHTSWNNILAYTDISITVISIAIACYVLYINDSTHVVSSFMLTMNVLNQLGSTIQQLIRFSNQINKLTTDYEEYRNFWTKALFDAEPVKLQLPANLNCTRVNISRGKFNVKLHNSVRKLQIAKQQMWLIRGKTGEGKSTFVNGITGKYAGVKMNVGNPTNYYHLFADMYQDIRENMPSNNLSIRNWFKDEKDDKVIIECIRDTFTEEEFENLKLALGTVDDSCWLDAELRGIPSGGQKSRLCLATRLYEVISRGKKILLLDEPEQGSDPSTARKILKHIEAKYRKQYGCMIILVTHMSKESLKKTGICFDRQFKVAKGVVYDYKYV